MKKRIKNIIYDLSKPLLNKILKYNNIHKGEECYLFGDGASIKWFDLNHFSDKISIPVSYIPFHNDFEKLNAKYCMLVEPNWFYPFVKTYVNPSKYIINHVQKAYRESILKNNHIDYFINLSNFPILQKSNIYYLYNNLPNTNIVKYFRQNGIDPLHGSLRASIILAIYMGFSKVYLVGYDYTHSPSRMLHWYEKGVGIEKDITDYNKDFFSLANDFIEIITVTIDKKSDKLKSITYKELTGYNPNYKENFEIISEKYLKILSTWPNYKL